MNRFHLIENVSFHGNNIILFIDKKSYTFELEDVSKKLLIASDEYRMVFDISPSGYGIHWPLIEEDLSIDGLLGIKHSVPGNIKAS